MNMDLSITLVLLKSRRISTSGVITIYKRHLPKLPVWLASTFHAIKVLNTRHLKQQTFSFTTVTGRPIRNWNQNGFRLRSRQQVTILKQSARKRDAASSKLSQSWWQIYNPSQSSRLLCILLRLCPA